MGGSRASSTTGRNSPPPPLQEERAEKMAGRRWGGEGAPESCPLSSQHIMKTVKGLRTKRDKDMAVREKVKLLHTLRTHWRYVI